MAMVGFALIKNGKAVKGCGNKPRVFNTRESAWKYAGNLIWVSKNLTKDSFKLVKVHG